MHGCIYLIKMDKKGNESVKLDARLDTKMPYN